MSQSYDYIVVGGGSAGCVIATRLIERTNARVLLLEAGPRDLDPYIHMPAGVGKAIAKHTLTHINPANPATGLPSIPLPQANVLGGGSSVNAMVYVRGTAHDYNDWESIYGCSGWGHDAVLPYFMRAEHNESLSAPRHGTEGHLWVSEHRYRHPLSSAFLRAGQELGYPYLTDICGAGEQEGVGFWQCTIRDGERSSTSQSYLKSVINNERLTLITNAVAHKILIEDGVAIGVSYLLHGQTKEAFAMKEVIIAAGAIGSPKLLLLSGIGPKDDLLELEIDLQASNPQVGKNLQDHLLVCLTAETPDMPSMLREAQGLQLLKAGLVWLTLHHDGIVGSNVTEAGAYLDIDSDGRIDTQIFAMPAINPGLLTPPAEGHKRPRPQDIIDGITLEVGHVYPQSRGEVRLKSADPFAGPYVQANYLSAPGDLEKQIAAMKLALTFFEAPSFKRIVRNVMPAAQDDKVLADFFRGHCSTIYHPTSTCRMGASPQDSVVDLELRVWGVEKLRVADSSVMPHIPSGNTNAPTIMIAERVVDFILASGSPSTKAERLFEMRGPADSPT